MRLYRYFSSHADTTLQEGRLRLTHASALNDPFEVVHQNVGRMTETDALQFFSSPLGKEAMERQRPKFKSENPEMAKQFFENIPLVARLYAACDQGPPQGDPREYQRQADEYLRFCCFTDADLLVDDGDILLWSHYAQKHKGVRIEFNFDPIKTKSVFSLHEVIYSDRQVSVDYSSLLMGNPFPFDEVCRTKSKAWSYEVEVRIISSIVSGLNTDGSVVEAYVSFDPSWVTGVDFGIKCPQKVIDSICSIIRAKYPQVIPRRAYQASDKFSIEYRQIE